MMAAVLVTRAVLYVRNRGFPWRLGFFLIICRVFEQVGAATRDNNDVNYFCFSPLSSYTLYCLGHAHA